MIKPISKTLILILAICLCAALAVFTASADEGEAQEPSFAAQIKEGDVVDSSLLAEADGELIPRDVSYFYLTERISLRAYDVLEEPLENGYYMARRAAYCIYSYDGSKLLLSSSNPGSIKTNAAPYAASSNKDGARLVVYSDFDLTNSLDGGNVIDIQNKFIFDLNGYTVSHHNVSSSTTCFFHVNKNCTLTLISSVEGGTLNYYAKGSTLNSLIYCAGSVAYGININIGSFEGAKGDNLTVNVTSLVQIRNYPASSAKPSHVENFVLTDTLLNIDGGTYYCNQKTTNSGTNSAIIMDNCAIVDIRNATFYTNHYFLYQTGTYTSGMHDSKLTNCDIYAGRLAFLVRAGTAGYTPMDVAMARADKFGQYVKDEQTGELVFVITEQERYDRLVIAMAEKCKTEILVTNCRFTGILNGKSCDRGSIILGEGNLFASAHNTNDDVVDIFTVISEENPIVKLADGVIPLLAEVPFGGQIMRNGTGSEEANNIASVSFDGGEVQLWFAGSTPSLTSKSDAGLPGVYDYAFAAWQKDGADIEALVPGEYSLTARYALVSDADVKFTLMEKNDLYLNIYIPNSTYIKADRETNDGYTSIGLESFVIYSTKIDILGEENAQLTYTVTVGDESVSETVILNIFDYFRAAIEQHRDSQIEFTAIADSARFISSLADAKLGAHVVRYDEILEACQGHFSSSKEILAFAPSVKGTPNSTVSEMQLEITSDGKFYMLFKRAEGSDKKWISVSFNGVEIGERYTLTALAQERGEETYFVLDMPIYLITKTLTATSGEETFSANLKSLLDETSPSYSLILDLYCYSDSMMAYKSIANQ